jgi:hypothetical protein
LVVYNLFFWLFPVKGFEEAHNIRILITLSTVIWYEIIISYFLFGQSETTRGYEWFEKAVHTSPNLFPVPSKQQTIVRGSRGAGSCNFLYPSRSSESDKSEFKGSAIFGQEKKTVRLQDNHMLGPQYIENRRANTLSDPGKLMLLGGCTRVRVVPP